MTGMSGYCDAFAASFSTKQCIAAWESVAVPCTCACLRNEKVWRELGDADAKDLIQIALVEMQTAKTMACDLLSEHGFNGQKLKAV